MIATDHAPHSLKDKRKGMAHSPFGIIGMETCFSLIIEELVRKKVLTPIEAIRKMTEIPAKIFHNISE